ncbi:MAG: AmmeMemoRadiSam system protein B [Synergistaceae bacterium]|nr:AmmeMemoRadiSam system protein B [Synergistaceae bacterium]
MINKIRALIVFANALLFFALLTGASAETAGAKTDAPTGVPVIKKIMTSPFEGDVIRAVEQIRAEKNAYTEAGGGENKIIGGITPHHGLALSMIARFYEHISAGSDAEKILRVWLLSPDHFKRARNYAVVCGEDWQTAGRILEADAEAKSGLSGMSVADADSRLFAEEHGITIHIPLIARYFPNAAVVPMVLRSDIPDVPLLMLKNYMLGELKETDLIILSMDLSHYKTPEGMAAEDERTLEVLANLEPMKTAHLDIDARRAASLVLRLFSEMGAERGVIIEHMDTSDILGHRVESGTSYATIVYERQ